ncbi:MAG: hypothetical protein B6D55_03815 [Candidatus Omnitrophica bacterium 4484_70.2]|nr:MAG: hypothetical protein B6D55_03815 [Candidatus Omnitrophica bacterium 4484_70.2]
MRKRLEKLNKVLGRLETIKGLGKSSFIDRKISSSLKEFIKLRNIILHEYLSINYQKVYQRLQNINIFKNILRLLLVF